MYHLVTLSIVIITALADVDKRECEKLFSPNATRCCKKTSDILDKLLKSEDLKECFQVNMDPALCEHELCLAKKTGFATDDNKLDKKKLEEDMTKDLRSEADLLKDLKSKCFNGDIVNYGPPEFCEFFKMRLCISAQMLNHCPDWNVNEACTEFKGLVPECVKTIF